MNLGTKVGIGLCALGLALRAWAFGAMDVSQDGNAYAAMGHALQVHGSFWMPWGDGLGLDTSPAYSHHYSPLYPAWLAAWYGALGFGITQTKLAAATAGALALATVFATTRNLFGAEKAWITTGLVAVIPRLVIVEGTGFSENLSLIPFTLMAWSLYKSTDNPRLTMLAGAMAGLSFLARSSLGPFILIAGLGGLAWRWKYRGWRGILDPWYLNAALTAATISAPWLLRNWTLWGSWESSNYHAFIYAHAWQHPWTWLMGTFWKLTLYAVLLALLAAAFKVEWRQGFREGGEKNHLLLLTVILVAALGAIVYGAFWVFEQTPPFWLDAERYLVFAYIPLLWFIVKQATRKDFPWRVAALGVVLAASSAWAIMLPTTSPEDSAAQGLIGHLNPGDTIGIQGASLGRYNFYSYLPTQDVSLWVCMGNSTDPCQGHHVDVLMGREATPPPGMSPVGRYSTRFITGGESLPVYVWETTT